MTARPSPPGAGSPRTIPVDNGISLGSVTIPLRDVPAPARYRLVVGLEGTPFENDWDVWVYPPPAETPPPPGVTDRPAGSTTRPWRPSRPAAACSC